MTSPELADYIENTIRACRARIVGTGAEQYALADGTQKFEEMPIMQLLRELRDENLDKINYMTMFDIRLQQIIDMLDALMEDPDTAPEVIL